MSSSEASRLLESSALSFIPFEPMPDQREVLRAMADFATAPAGRGIFVLNGYAGTGKTSLVGALIKGMEKCKMKVKVLAPTGRAAKVASGFSGRPASTIHRCIYRPDPSDPSGFTYILSPNESTDTLFIVDEASLINDSPHRPSEGLLGQLIRYVYRAPGCRIMMVGDEAQLPPVGQESATAMNPGRLRSLGLTPICRSLELPVRQSYDSGIVHNATIVRTFLFTTPPDGIPWLDASGFPDIVPVSSADLADALSESFSHVGMEETLVITRSNKRANRFNQAIRNMVMYADQPLERGDRIVVSKNNYYWTKKIRGVPMLANGETAEVSWVGRTEKAHGRWFTDVELTLGSGAIVPVKIMLRSLLCDGPSIPKPEMDRFQNHVMQCIEGEWSQKMAAAKEDPYFNALQAKYAYCVTCHKAQGGQWKHIYIDMEGIPTDAYGTDFYRWLYTALTRATEKVYLINPGIPIR